MQIARHLRSTALMLLASVAATTLASPARADLVEEIVQRNELRVAVQTQGPPVSFINADGKRTGFAVEVARDLADKMGVEIKFLDYEWKGLIPALLSGKADLIAADMTPTVKRSLRLSFTQPVFYSSVVAFSKGDRFTAWQDVNQQGVTVAVVQGSNHVGIAAERLPKAEIKEYSGGGPAVAQAVASGRADAGINSRSSASVFTREFEDLQILEGTVKKTPLSLAVRPQSAHLLHLIDNYITFMKTSGELDGMVEYWWQTDRWEADRK